MADLIFIFIITGFYLIAIAYIAACDRMRTGEKK